MTMLAVVTVGLPGCGKSTWARGLHPGFVELNLDELRAAVAGDATDQHATPRALGRRRRLLAELAAEGRDVVISDTHARRRDRLRTIRELRALGYVVRLVFFNVGEATCLGRNAARARQVPEAAIAAMVRRLLDCPPRPDEADQFVELTDPADPLLPRSAG